MPTGPAAHVPGDLAVLTVAEMYAADRAAAAAGVPSLSLMERAGAQVAAAVTARWPRQPVAVLCGPGNNGGDGYVAARHLRDAGWPVAVARLAGDLPPDAAANAERWRAGGGRIDTVAESALEGIGLAVDALFGAGLRRPLEGEARTVVEALNARGTAVVAVDVPSGLAGDSGDVLGTAPRADVTVTFFRLKPAHLLFPGRELCGELVVGDIGIPSAVLDAIRPQTALIAPGLWRLPLPGWSDHKYTRGHGIVVGGGEITGAARLAARAARRVGAGLLTLAVPPAAVPIYAASEPGCFVQTRSDATLAAVLADPRRNGILIGPGVGVGSATVTLVRESLGTERPAVLDADALTSFAERQEALFAAIRRRAAATVLTPHAREFERLFGALPGSKCVQARAAAARSGATVVLKGADTVVASPDGRAAIAANAPPWLATGGSGDVLAGLILGLLVQGCDAWTASTAAVWLQGAAAGLLGRGLLAEDLPEAVAAVLRDA
jgi:NAD(P)H-hydrate epimerase